MVALLAVSATTVQAQGPLVPTNAPGLTMKTLDQVEARIPISSIPITLNNSGSYYLTAPLSMGSNLHGIQISADNVTIDLNGYSLVGTSNSHSGVYIIGLHSNIVVKNGSLMGWGWEGVDLNSADNGRVERLQVSGVIRSGIRLGLNGKALDCQVIGGRAGLVGFEACEFRQCQALNIRGHGFEPGSRALIEGCQAINCGTNGIYAGNETVIRNCQVISNQASGISVGTRCEVSDNYANNNGLSGTGAHIHCRGNQNRVERNQLFETSDAVIRARTIENVITDNVVLDTLPSYDLSATNSINILIHKLPVTLNWPCYARLAGSLGGPDGIIIMTNGVTLDLGGHTLDGRGVGTTGILLSGAHDVVIRNGVIRGWSSFGVNGSNSEFGRVEEVEFTRNGTGLRLSEGAMVSHCRFIRNIAKGTQCGHASTITHCEAVENGEEGIQVGFGCLISHCVARENTGDGIATGVGCEVTQCTANNNGDTGIRVSNASFVHHNNAALNSDGIAASANGSRIEDNNITYNTGVGIIVSADRNIIIRNTAGQNSGGNYDIAAGNATGILVNATAGGAIANSNPWVNFSF
jgi:parallel beta-helix repeat protein